MHDALEREASRSIFNASKPINGRGSRNREHYHDQGCASQNSLRNIDTRLRQRNQFCAQQKVNRGAGGKNKRMRNKPEFVSAAGFDLLAAFFTGGPLELFAN